ncbi:unnamed protein product [Caenorhabditis auriculariae]|uniref:SH3 domain-containing protein n=1 Tax=Caenorhabditis auriculariae TaxID=2777116 RepID=A0A8S1HL15_9PELO|nr:unnamed protein product [Caenorhabditis auriculariae]
MRRGAPGGDPYQSRPSPGYYYSRPGGIPAAAPSPSYSQQSRAPMSQPIGRRSADYRAEPRYERDVREHGFASAEPRLEDNTPSYNVEHLATFAVGRQFGLTVPADGIRKLKQMEKNSAIWAQPLILRFRQNIVTVEDENGDLVEQFPLDLIEQPTAHVSSDPRDTYNNMLLFVVREDRKRTNTPTEMHIFQCNRVAANEVADDLQAYIRGQFRRVRNGRRSSSSFPPQQQMPFYPPDDASISSESTELFEREVNTLNRCFDDIERFVARIQSAAIAQREIEQQNYRYRTAQRRDKRQNAPDPNGILYRRAQLPIEAEFIDVFKKFKLSFNLLAKLKNHIHEPNAPELLHFLFTPLSVILEACHWGLGRNLAPSVLSPLLSLEARELMQNCLNSRESDIWMSLGEAWRTPPEDWAGNLPPPYRPMFMDGFAPYGVADRGTPVPNPLHRGQSAPPEHYRQPPSSRERNALDTAPNTPVSSRNRPSRPHRNMSVDNLELDRLSLERERLEFEKAKIVERESRLRAEEKQIEDEKRRMQAEKSLIKKESREEPPVVNNARYDPVLPQPSPAQRQPPYSNVRVVVDADTSPRQQAFIDDVVSRAGKLVVATFDRVAQNPKELTVSRGEYLEVLYDEKNWWECKNMHQRVGYVPHTILSMVPLEHQQPAYASPNGGAISQRHLPPAPVVQSTRHMTVSDAGVQVEIKQQHPPQPPPQPPQPVYVPPPPPPQVIVAPPAPPPPPAPPISDFQQRIQQKALKQTSQPESPRENLYSPPRPAIDISRRTANPQLIGELSETISRRDGNALRAAGSRQAKVAIDERSTPEEVSLWLQVKGFSPRVIDLLDGQDGANLFSLSKLHLQQAAGREEGSHLYSQLLVQKKRSGFRTHTADELKAILHQRRHHVELSNETPANEPTFAVNGH